MSPSSPSARPLAVLSHALIPLALFAAACSGGGGSSPTDPGPATATGSATVTGQVSVAGGGGSGGPVTGAVVQPGAAAPAGLPKPGSTAGAQGPAVLTAADASGAGVTVRIQGTSLATDADAEGRFHLDGVPHGNQVVVFETAEASAGVVVDEVQPHERIRMSVRVSGGNVEVTDMDREGGGTEGPDDGEDEEGELDLSLQLSPSTWNLNYDHSAGTVTAFIRGQGFRDVVLGSILLVGDDDEAEPLEPVDVSRQGNNVRARFAKNEVLDVLSDPENGSVHTVALQFEVAGVEELQELTAEVRIVGPDDGEEEDDGEDDEELGNLSLQLSPSTWNTNFSGAKGHVTAFIRGTGLGAVDTDSVEMVGDDPEAEPLPASSARMEGNHVRAQFPRSQVLDLLDEPERGTTHTVIVRFTSDGGAGSHELEAEVRIVGPPA